MIYSEFVKPYGKKPPYPHHGRFASDMEQASSFSNAFGAFLHDKLSGIETGPASETVIPEYVNWVGKGGYIDIRMKIGEALYENSNDEEALRCLRELNFHSLNIGMLSMWNMLDRDPNEPNPNRLRDIRTAQDIVALSALEHLTVREREASSRKQYEFHKPENAFVRNSINGLLLEADAGIVLLEMMKTHRELTVLPSPDQFEHSHPKRYNSDFMILDTARKRAIGAQVKTSVEVSREKAEESGQSFDYDPDRIMFIDGDADLGSRLVIKSAAHKSPALATWPGMISAQHFKAIKRPSHRRGETPPTIYQLLGEQEVARNKLLARSILGKRALALAPVVDRITRRTLARI